MHNALFEMEAKLEDANLPNEPARLKGPDPELLFQKTAFDRAIRGASPNVDSAPVVQQVRRGSLTPRTYHTMTSNKTLSHLVEEALAGLGELLEDET